MSFGKNPHTAKALAAEQKAEEAIDQPARVLAYREAAHQWDRAASREDPGTKRNEYEANAERNRSLADGEEDPHAKLVAEMAANPMSHFQFRSLPKRERLLN